MPSAPDAARAFDILAGDHHQVGHFVDDDDDIGQRLQIEFFRLIHGFAGLAVKAGLYGSRQDFALVERLLNAGVEAIDVTNTDLRHFLVALFHLPHGPFQRDDGLLGIGDDRREQMRNAVIDRQFEHLRIDHDQAALFRRHAIDERQDHGVDRDRLTRAGGTGHEKMRHLGKIGDDSFATDRLAECHRQLGLAAFEITRPDKFAQEHRFARAVGKLDTNGIAARNDGDARGNRAHRAGDIVRQTDNARRLDAGRRFKLIKRYDRAWTHMDDFALDAEVFQHALKPPGILLQNVRVQRVVLDDILWLGQQMDRRNLETIWRNKRGLRFACNPLARLRPRRWCGNTRRASRCRAWSKGRITGENTIGQALFVVEWRLVEIVVDGRCLSACTRFRPFLEGGLCPLQTVDRSLQS